MTMYFLLMLVIRGGNSTPLMVFTYESQCEVSRVANVHETYCLKMVGPKS